MDFNTNDCTSTYDPADIQANKGITILSYISWLVLVPLLARKDSRFARFHSNQGFVLAIIGTAISITGTVITTPLNLAHLWVVSTVISVLFWLLEIPVLVFCIIGIVNVAQGRAVELPIIGKIKIFK
ncbi:MAG: hypothetical protein ACI4F8_10715 [Lachnospiraceae bacterium]